MKGWISQEALPQDIARRVCLYGWVRNGQLTELIWRDDPNVRVCFSQGVLNTSHHRVLEFREMFMFERGGYDDSNGILGG